MADLPETPEPEWIIEEMTCTCGAGHGSGEEHMEWCDWLEHGLPSDTPWRRPMADRYVMVPVEATEEMLDAHDRAHAAAETVFADPGDVYRAMIAARPSVGEEVVKEVAGIYAVHRWRLSPLMGGPLSGLNPPQLREAMDAARAILNTLKGN